MRARLLARTILIFIIGFSYVARASHCLEKVMVLKSSKQSHSIELSSSVDVNMNPPYFEVHQSWKLIGVKKSEVLAAVKELRLTGKFGVYQDSKLIETSTPIDMQNFDGQMIANGTHPLLVPEILSSTAKIEANSNGFIAKMVDGPIGTGSSAVTIDSAEKENGEPVVYLSERGQYQLSINGDGILVDMANFFTSWLPGEVMNASGHEVMGHLHNHVFNPAAAISNIVAYRRARPNGPLPID